MMTQHLDKTNLEYLRALSSKSNVARATAMAVARIERARGEDRTHWSGAKVVLGHLLRLNDADRATVVINEWKHLHPGVQEILKLASDEGAVEHARETRSREAIQLIDSDRRISLDRAANTIVGENGRTLATLDANAGHAVRLAEHAAAHASRVLLDARADEMWPSGTLGWASNPAQDFASAVAAPATLVRHLKGSWFGQLSDDAVSQVIPRGATHGAAVPEIDPQLVATAFDLLPYYLASYLTAEKRSNADFSADTVAIARIVDALLLARELRVAALLTTSANWNANNVVTLAAGAKWNGGPSADPISNIFAVLAASTLPVTHMVMSEGTARWYFSNTGVRDYVQAGGVLPKVIVAKARTKVSGALTLVWGGDVVLVRAPQNENDVATARTFQWSGTGDSDTAESVIRTMGRGLLVRVAELTQRGARGGQLLVCGADEQSVLLDGTIGGLIKGAVQ